MANRLATLAQPLPAPARRQPGRLVGVGDEAFAEARRRDVPVLLSRRVRRLPLVPRHGARVVRGRRAWPRPLNERLRRDQGRPRGAARRRRRLHGGDHGDDRAGRLADDRASSPRTATRSSPAPTCPSAPARSRCWPPSTRPGRTPRATCCASRAPRRRAAARASPATPAPRRRRRRRAATTRSTALARELRRARGGFGGAPKFPPSMVLEFLLRHHARTGSADALAMARRARCEAMARGGMYDQLGGGFARYSVDAGWVVPHFEKMLYDNALLLRVYAHCGAPPATPLARAGRRARPPTSCCATCAPPRAGSPRRWTPTPTGVRGHDLRLDARRSSSRCSAPTTAPWAADAARRHRRRARSSTAPRRCSCAPTPTTRAWWRGTRARLLAARARAPAAGPRRQGRRGVERAGDRRPRRGRRRCSDRADAASTPPRECAGFVARRPRRRRAAAAGLARRGRRSPPPASLEDHGNLAEGLLALHQATGDARWLRGRARLLDAALERFGADDGGFYDTADDAEPLFARPRSPPTTPSPRGVGAGRRAAHVRRAHRRRPATRGGSRGPGRLRPAGRCRSRGSPAGRWPSPRRSSPGRCRSPWSVRVRLRRPCSRWPAPAPSPASPTRSGPDTP